MTAVCTGDPATAGLPASRDGAPGRAFLADFAVTLLVPLAAAAALLAGWSLSSAAGVPAAAAAVAGWAVAVAFWLRRRGWPLAIRHLVAWAVPVTVLAPLAGLGWLSSDELVLWWPATGVLALAWAMAHRAQPKFG